MLDKSNTPNDNPSSSLSDAFTHEKGLLHDTLTSEGEMAQSPVYDALVVAHNLAVSVRDMASNPETLERGRNRFLEVTGSLGNPETELVIDTFLDREFSHVGVMRKTGRHTNTDEIGSFEGLPESERFYFNHVLQVGAWMLYARQNRDIDRDRRA